MPVQYKPLFTRARKCLLRKVSLLLTALMLGMSNVILEEDRSLTDTRAKIEYREIQSEDE
ncbi:MAG: hypothetical protein Mars2KO_06780 [Maribacter sp.]|uniref:hypothetical protein n=1 Tax=Maribacter sp. 2307UL18-2 TaxID=3386274 RepID=UPI0039BC5950